RARAVVRHVGKRSADVVHADGGVAGALTGRRRVARGRPRVARRAVGGRGAAVAAAAADVVVAVAADALATLFPRFAVGQIGDTLAVPIAVRALVAFGVVRA